MLIEVGAASSGGVLSIAEGLKAMSESLTQWGLLVFGGTVALLMGTEFRRPKSVRVRYTYWLFLFGWFMIALSLYRGTRVHRAYLRLLFDQGQLSLDSLRPLNAHLDCQLTFFQVAAFPFAAWLVVYLWWWIHHKESGSA